MAKKKLYDKADKKLQRISKTIGAITAIIVAVTGACTWVSNQFRNAVSAQINGLSAEIKESDEEQTLLLARLELLGLMEHDPDNTVAVEKLARRYFTVLNGDSWMSERYSRYAHEHNLDTSFVIGEK